MLKTKVKTHLSLGRETSEGVKTLKPNHPLSSHSLSFQTLESVFISPELWSLGEVEDMEKSSPRKRQVVAEGDCDMALCSHHLGKSLL